MCFSATVSFITGGALVGTSALVYSRIKIPRSSRCLASIPLIFGLHQCSEGLVWLGVDQQISQQLADAAKYLYSFIAMSFWPFFIPLSILLYQYPKHHIPLKLVLAIGTVLGLYFLWSFTIASPMQIRVNCGHSIAYLFKPPYFFSYLDKIYVFSVIIPFVLAQNPRIRYLLGPAFLGSFILAKHLETMDNYPSIWCYLAALISVIIFYVLYTPETKIPVARVQQ
ncbi:MAG: DUF6629 family protein [Pseudomonadota bacterium]